MNRQDQHDDPLLSAAWALDALDDDERAAFEERLRTHPDERADADALRETASRLSAATAPPPHLRASVLAALATTPQERPSAPVVDLSSERSRRRGPSRWSALVAAAGILVGAVGVGVGVGVANRSGDTVVSADRVARQNITDLMATPGARVSTVAATDGGTATLVQADGRIGVLTSGLPAAGGGRDYQLWLARGDALTSAGMLHVTSAGGSAVVVAAGSATGVGISLEPARGSAQPTTTPVVFTPLSA
ncbi:anti-sigma factor domain-containing protein [Kineococcus sp. DHX-1]|uniref:anti-sigma factor n=1 Tax=Kineococcus sp. DHX-1 TaxID=3349638 RepID=UPI0036D2B688